MTDTVERPFAVVTGASSGIGHQLSRQLLDRGYDVLMVAENAELSAVGERLSADSEEESELASIAVSGDDEPPLGQVSTLRADLSTAEGNDAVVAAVDETGRVPAVLALNAGVGNAGAFLDSSLAADLALIGLNVASPVHLAKRLLPAMVRAGEGHVLITSSIAGTMPGPFYATYAASKAFLLSFAEAVGYELRDSGVSVTAVLPGPTDTDFFDRAGMQDTKVNRGTKDDPADVAAEALEALFAGKTKVVAGSFANKAQATAARAVPDPLKARLHAQQTEPRSD